MIKKYLEFIKENNQAKYMIELFLLDIFDDLDIEPEIEEYLFDDVVNVDTIKKNPELFNEYRFACELPKKYFLIKWSGISQSQKKDFIWRIEKLADNLVLSEYDFNKSVVIYDKSFDVLKLTDIFDFNIGDEQECNFSTIGIQEDHIAVKSDVASFFKSLTRYESFNDALDFYDYDREDLFDDIARYSKRHMGYDVEVDDDYEYITIKINNTLFDNAFISDILSNLEDDFFYTIEELAFKYYYF